MDDDATISTDVLADVANEIRAAVAKHGTRNTPLSWDMRTAQKLSVLVEEVGEVAHEINERYLGDDVTDLKAELVQVAAVALMWLESLRTVHV